MPVTSKKPSLSTEASIKKAAHKVFLAKGFSATTVRVVAKEAGVNIALVNYYFRSKKNLFDIVMSEKIQTLLSRLIPILNNETSTLYIKFEGLAYTYIDFLKENPDLLPFIFNELRKDNYKFLSNVQLAENVFNSFFMKQLKEKCGDVNPLHLLFSLIGMIAFPFVAKPAILQAGLVDEKVFQRMMEERKTLIPAWAKTILSINSKA